MRVLVTGAAGYIGSVLVPTLLRAGHSVLAVDRFFFGQTLPEHPNVELCQQDSRLISAELFGGLDAVIDLVAISNDPSGDAFEQPTWQINFESRKTTAQLAKEAGVKRYILPSSCSIYGFQDDIVDETSSVNPLTTYAKANLAAEEAVLGLSDSDFCVTVIRQSTIFGLSPRMRFDLAINGMTYGAWKTGKLPLMRDGSQYRPMLHVADTSDLMTCLLQTDSSKIDGKIFNAGCEEQNYQIGQLGEIVSKQVSDIIGSEVSIEWYGDPDHRSYRVNFDKVTKATGWSPKRKAEDGVIEICQALANKTLDKTEQTITLEWYKKLQANPESFAHLLINGSMLELEQ